MNESQATQLGLVFHGATARYWDQEEVIHLKARAKEIRKLGFDAIAVKSKKSEWGCGNYVLYVSPDYMKYQEALSHIAYIQNEEKYVQHILDNANKEIQEIKDKAESYRKMCDKYNIKYNKDSNE